MSAFQELKLAVISATGLSKDALHVYAGLLVFLVVISGLRRPLHSVGPWLAVLVVAVVIELMDMRDNLSGLGQWQWAESLHDIINTIFWPTVLLFLARSGRLAGTRAA